MEVPSGSREAVVRGVRALVVRNVTGRALGMLGGLAMAALLGPADYGVAAVGVGALHFLTLIGAPGLAATALRRTEDPTEAELRALFTFQVIFGVVVAGMTSLVAFVVLPALDAASDEMNAIALLSFTLPVTAWRLVPTTLLERDMHYGAIARIDIVEGLGYYAIAIPLAATGFGLPSVAVGLVGAALLADVLAIHARPVVPRPTLRFGALRPLVRFGAKYQFNNLLGVTRDTGVIVLLLSFAGAEIAGIWALVQRIMQAPLTVLHAIWRIAFVAFSKIQHQAEETRRMAQRILDLTAVGAPGLFGLVVAVTPAVVDVVLGDEWQDAVVPTALVAFGWLINGPISGAVLGLVQSRNQLRAPIVAAGIDIVVMSATAVLLAPVWGVTALAGAWVAVSALRAALYVHAARSIVTLDLRPIAFGVSVGIAVAAAGVAAGEAAQGVLALVAAGAAAVAVWLVLAGLLRPRDMRWLATTALGRRPRTHLEPVGTAP